MIKKMEQFTLKDRELKQAIVYFQRQLDQKCEELNKLQLLIASQTDSKLKTELKLMELQNAKINKKLKKGGKNPISAIPQSLLDQLMSNDLSSIMKFEIAKGSEQ